MYLFSLSGIYFLKFKITATSQQHGNNLYKKMKKAGASTVSKSSGAQKNLFSFFKKSTALPVEMTPEQSNTVEVERVVYINL